jgi:hypothetical protein
MDLHFLAQALSHAATAIDLDESSLSVLVMLLGIIGGWTLSARLQPKAKKVRVERKTDRSGPTHRE